MILRRLLTLACLLVLFASGASCARSGGGDEVSLSALPPEARATYSLIRKGGPFPYSKDGTTFFNREGLLPARPRGHYREYTVPTPGAKNRGARRIVVGGDPPADFWYTDDHYRSFRRIRE
ncbi:ribonuclease N1 [Burkholderiaceae bacterium FT117]|uniref:ribonuclease domain-containing protein n=1 Tax=Zeimonas sediminis TaxID=2944268 RepID=UPI0023430F1A|nr:ribonuclease domain-containing protein [Zeimonas sediminis]MCM5570245.1 ribonuclease N1 [Zeimonas sediminis]